MQTISGKSYYFNADGIMEYEVNEEDASIGRPGEAHTIKIIFWGAAAGGQHAVCLGRRMGTAHSHIHRGLSPVEDLV